MKIGIEAQRLFRKKKHGIEFVAIELIKNLQVIDKKNQYFIFVKSDEDNTSIKETENFKIVEINACSYPIWEQFVLPYEVKRHNCDLLHCTSNTAPIYPKAPLIITIHDIIYLEKSNFNIISNKGTNYQRFGNLYRRYIVPKIVNSAEKIITVSNFEKKRINDFFNFSVDNEKVISIYNGVSEHFRKIEDKIELQRVRSKYNLPEEFILFLGNTDPKKNTINVLKAFSDLIENYHYHIKLVILDYKKEQLSIQLNEIGKPSLIENIQLCGYVVNTDLPAIYNLSKLFLYPSLRESFGIPLLEAMRCGTPIITSNTSSMPEIAGDAAYLVNPSEHECICEAMYELLNNETFRNDLIIKGYKQCGEFGWKKMALNILDLYNKIQI